MSEKVTVTHINQPFSGPFSMERHEFYEEQVNIWENLGKPTQAVSIVNAILINEAGELIIQKRASHKNHNPNLLDKSIGGHIKRGDTVDHTVMVETVEELQVPSIVIREDDDFAKRFELLEDYLSTIAILKHIDTRVFTLKKVMKEGTVEIANKVYIYFGVYGGSVKNVDKEAKGILFYNLDDLKTEMKQFPALFTDDLHVFIAEYEDQLRAFIDLVTTKEK